MKIKKIIYIIDSLFYNSFDSNILELLSRIGGIIV